MGDYELELEAESSIRSTIEALVSVGVFRQ